MHLIYGKLDIKFEQLWYPKSRLTVCLKLIGSKWCSNLLHIKNLIYYDYNFHNLIIHKYFFRAPLNWNLKKINISFTCSPFCKIRHFVQVEIFFKILLNSTFKMGFSNVLNIKWKIIIMLIIIPKKNYFQYIKFISWLHYYYFG